LQYSEKIFIPRITESHPIHSLAQKLQESICANDKKAVYQLIVKLNVDVNTIGCQALSGMSSGSEVSTPAKFL